MLLHMLDSFDYKTLLACECVLAIVFSIVFLGMHRMFPQVHGTRSIALSFGLLVPETIFIALGGHVTPVISVLMANTLTLGSLIAMYEAVMQFSGGVNRRWVLWFMAFVSFAVVYYNTEVRVDLLPCIVAVSLSMALTRALTAQALLSRSMRSTQRKTLAVFGLFMGTLAFVSARLAVMTWIRGVPAGMTLRGAEQVTMRVTGMVYMAVAGLCFLVLASRELVTRRRQNEHQDSLTATFNRRGLEVNLAIALERFERSADVFSVALVEVDQFQTILQSKGRPAGNEMLREVAETLSRQLRGTDHLGRFTAEEFLLIFTHVSHSEAMIAMHRIAAEIGKVSVGNTAHRLTLSVGITEAARGDSTTRLISRAERALYQARTEGRNCRRVVLEELPGLPTTEDEAVSAVA